MFLVNCHLNIFTVNIIEHMWTGVVRPLLALHMFDHKLIELCHFSLFEQSLQIDWVQSTLSFSLQKVSLLFELGWHRQKHICQLMITNGIHAVSYWDVYSIILIYFFSTRHFSSIQWLFKTIKHSIILWVTFINIAINSFNIIYICALRSLQIDMRE